MGNPSLTNAKQLYNMMRNSKNPTQFLQNMSMQNPQMQSVMNMVRQSGKSPKDFFYALAQQKGVDPNQILNSLR